MSTPAPRRLAALSLALAVALAAPAARAAELRWHGLLDLVGSELTPAFDSNRLTRGDDPFDPWRARLFVESPLDEHFQVLGQFVLSDATNLYVDGAYVVATPWPERDLHVMAGKLPWPIGTWGPRTYSNKNPLVGTPLLYQYHSSLPWYELPPTADALLAAAGSGQTGVGYYGRVDGVGMPIVDDSYWDVGVTVTGSRRPLEVAFGVMAGAPGWGSTTKDDNSGKTVLGRLGLAPSPYVRVGVSGAYGPYLAAFLDPAMPPGKNVNNYAQQLVMADLELTAGHAELHAEGAHNVWQVPRLGDLAVDAGYAELKWALPSGLFLAGRWDIERFGDLADSTGAKHAWDWNVTRLEGGVGYRMTRDAIAKLTTQHTRFDTGRAADRWRRQSMLAAQLSVSF